MSGPCAKRHVTCEIEGAFGENLCETPQSVCPRGPGEDYTKCRTVCNQHGGHAEIAAIADAKAKGLDVLGATAVVRGHYWICEPCGRALREAGIKAVLVELSA